MEDAQENHGFTLEQIEAMEKAFAAIVAAVEVAARAISEFWEATKRALRAVAPNAMRAARRKARRTNKRRHWRVYAWWRSLYQAIRGPNGHRRIMPAPGDQS